VEPIRDRIVLLPERSLQATGMLILAVAVWAVNHLVETKENKVLIFLVKV
jgi:hypothetical protein